jgi:hypothetical protein
MNTLPCTVTGNVTIESGGTVTHPATNIAANAIDLSVVGSVTVMNGGQINADQRSTYKRPCPTYGAAGAVYPSHGGRGQDGNIDVSNDVYGNFQAVDTLGQSNYGAFVGGRSGGGLVRITAGSLVLNGVIQARGYRSSTGGGIGIVITGGSVTGSGVLDVSVDSGSTTNQYYRAGGGRISVTGYNTISDAIVANARMDGSRWYDSGAGTFYHRSSSDWGNLMVKTVRYNPGTVTDESRTAVISVPTGTRLSVASALHHQQAFAHCGWYGIDSNRRSGDIVWRVVFAGWHGIDSNR